MILEAAQKLLASVCVGVGTCAPAGTTWARSPLAAHGAGRLKPLGFWITSCTTLKHHSKLLRSQLPSSRWLGALPSFPITPGQHQASADARRTSCPAPCAPDGCKAGNPSWAATPQLGQRRGRKGPGTPDKLLLYCQSKVSR